MELDCSVLTPKTVLDVSGHTEKFCDFLVTRKADEEPMRADHLLEEWIDARLADEANPLTADEEVNNDTSCCCCYIEMLNNCVLVLCVDRT